MSKLAFEKNMAFAEVIYAANISAKRLRNWLDRGLITLSAEDREAEGKHRRFSFLDAVRIAVVASLTNYGLSAENASELVEQTIGTMPDFVKKFPTAFKHFEKMPIEELVNYFRNTNAIVHVDEHGSSLELDYGLPAKKLNGYDTFLILRLDRIVEEVYERFKELE